MILKPSSLLARAKSVKFVNNFSSAAASAATNANSESKKAGAHNKKYADRPIIQEQRKRNQELEAKAKAMNLEWRVVGST